jgi:RHS repeat-associated protein
MTISATLPHTTEPDRSRLTGKERDSESGNDYFGARYYSSNDARFLTPDPLPWIAWQNGNRTQQQAFEAHIANPQDLNMYSYVLNNPLSKTDPTGMNACGTSNKDSSCTVTVTLQDRTKDANGHYNDQFSNQKGNGAYNATATVTVSDHGKVIATGKFLASTVPSGKGFATIKNGTYSGTLGFHDHHAAILLNGGGAVPVVGGVDPATGKSYATGIFVHIAGLPTSANPMGGTGMTRNGMPISAGCQLICSTQYGAFEGVTGLNASPPQNNFTVTVDTSENQ